MSETPTNRYRLGNTGPAPQWGLEIASAYIRTPMPDLRLAEKIVLVNILFDGFDGDQGQWWDGKGAFDVDPRTIGQRAGLSERRVARALAKLVELDYLAPEQ